MCLWTACKALLDTFMWLNRLWLVEESWGKVHNHMEVVFQDVTGDNFYEDQDDIIFMILFIRMIFLDVVFCVIKDDHFRIIKVTILIL